ncbi:MAG: hypothetical protein F6J89_17950 [Symploca sp. SIO1C4]|uniref:Uncharacterized protein n=1 Tax=Symploca sp. SIO1C4 TaxID=2607765 RepID=A0A6B3NCZ9_9CYAN|nr:hypothetical protein [Symploca sp. SIO1C4]
MRRETEKKDYVARQYLESIGKIEQRIASVNAYGIYQNISFSLIFKILKTIWFSRFSRRHESITTLFS